MFQDYVVLVLSLATFMTKTHGQISLGRQRGTGTRDPRPPSRGYQSLEQSLMDKIQADLMSEYFEISYPRHRNIPRSHYQLLDMDAPEPSENFRSRHRRPMTRSRSQRRGADKIRTGLSSLGTRQMIPTPPEVPPTSAASRAKSYRTDVPKRRSRLTSSLDPDAMDDLMDMAQSVRSLFGEPQTQSLSSLSSSSSSKRSMSKRTRPTREYRCDTTKLTIQTILEFIHSGTICGFNVSSMRFGLGRR